MEFSANMRKYVLFVFLLAATGAQAQKALTGLWTGTLSNDSTTIRRDQSFEIALTQYKEKVYGYTRSSFIVNDTLYYIVKRVKGKVDGNTAEVTDDDVITHNFRGKVDKGVKVTFTFHMNSVDSSWQLDGEWKTKKTKNYYSLTGKADLKEEKNLDNSKIFPHLEELKLDQDLPFYAEAKAPAKSANDPPKSEPVTSKPVAAAKPKAEKIKPAKDEAKEELAKNKKKEKTAESSSNATTAETRETGTARNEPPVTKPATAATPVPAKTTAERIQERINLTPQLVNFKSDSLTLALYDNGEVDGDTVSVLLNGVVIIEKLGLKTTAVKKTIQVPVDQDEMTMVLFAENLGKYPPNTGLLVVRDGEDVYQVRFSADLTQNATIIFRRKK